MLKTTHANTNERYLIMRRHVRKIFNDRLFETIDEELDITTPNEDVKSGYEMDDIPTIYYRCDNASYPKAKTLFPGTTHFRVIPNRDIFSRTDVVYVTLHPAVLNHAEMHVRFALGYRDGKAQVLGIMLNRHNNEKNAAAAEKDADFVKCLQAATRVINTALKKTQKQCRLRAPKRGKMKEAFVGLRTPIVGAC